MRFAHISDLHLCPDPVANPSVNDDANRMAERLAQDLAGIRDGLDLVVMTGDLTDDASSWSFGRFEELFRDLGLPMVTVPGNHDGPSGYHAHKTGSGLFAGWDISERVVEIGALRLLGIDTCVEGATTGAIPEASLTHLEQELGTAGPPLVVVMHHPPFLPGLREFDEISALEGTERFAALLRGAAVPPTVLCGHVHRPYVAVHAGAVCFVGGSPARTFGASLPFGAGPIRPSPEPFSYAVHRIGKDGSHVMTPRRIGG
jgi:3',5'-cyclic AMP phosphodiesterase CpdA